MVAPALIEARRGVCTMRAMDDYVLPLAGLTRAPLEIDRIGGKAAGLARLMAAGVPVPPGWVITADVSALAAPAQEAVLAELAARLRGLGGRFAVRSSAAMEDGASGAAAGVFESRLGVAPAALADAVRAVWASAGSEHARAYAAARGLGPAAMAVIVQQQAEGGRRGVLYTRPPGEPGGDEMLIEVRTGDDRTAAAESGAAALAVVDTIWVERSGHGASEGEGGSAVASRRVRVAGADEDEGEAASRSRLAGAEIDALVKLAHTVEAALEAPHGADIEWVQGQIAGVSPGVESGSVSDPASPARLWIVQARPIVAPARAAADQRCPPMLLAFSRAEPEVVWRWDVGHNPDPLSPAQAGLVERVAAAGLAPYRMRVVGGYLYCASAREAGAAGVRDIDAADVAAATAEQLQRRFDDEWRPALMAALAVAEAPEAPLAAVLDSYERFYEVYVGPLSRHLRSARGALQRWLADHLGALGDGDGGVEPLAAALLSDPAPTRLERWILRCARDQISRAQLLAVAGPMSAAWDVAAPTFAETPGWLDDAVQAARARDASAPSADDDVRAAVREREAELERRLSGPERAELRRVLALARRARDLGEVDDQLFARAQAAVRRSLLERARAWSLPDPEDLFFVPFEVAAQADDSAPPPLTALRRMAQAGRAARARQRKWRMPLAFSGGAARAPDDPASQLAGHRWRGRSTGGRARGAALCIDDLSQLGAVTPADIADKILIVPTITPAMTVLLQHAGAVVAEHGGLLDHGAAMARELGLPYVVSCSSITGQVETGDELLVDGDAGLVLRVQRGER
ncbi:MAG: hypothetical protein Tsb0020_36770 [Haliangiales bacterium]